MNDNNSDEREKRTASSSLLMSSPFSSPLGHVAPPYTRILLTSTSVTAAGSTLTNAPLPFKLQPHISSDEWSEFVSRMQPAVEKLNKSNKQMNQIGWAAALLAFGCTLCYILFSLKYFEELYGLITIVFWCTLSFIMMAYTRWSKSRRASQLAELRDICRAEEEKFFRQRGFSVECHYVLSTSECVGEGRVFPVGFYIYFFPIRNDQIPDQYPLSDTNDSFKSGLRNGYLTIEIDRESPPTWFCPFSSVQVRPPAQFESIGVLPFKSHPTAIEVWDRFWPLMTQRSLKLGSLIPWLGPVLFAYCLSMLVHVGLVFSSNVSELYNLLFLLLFLSCLVAMIYVSTRINSLTVDRRALITEYASEFAAHGLLMGDRCEYQLHQSGNDLSVLSVYSINIYPLEPLTNRIPEVV